MASRINVKSFVTQLLLSGADKTVPMLRDQQCLLADWLFIKH